MNCYHIWVYLVAFLLITCMIAYYVINEINNTKYEIRIALNSIDSLTSKAETLLSDYIPLIEGVKARCDEINCINDLMNLLDNKTVACK